MEKNGGVPIDSRSHNENGGYDLWRVRMKSYLEAIAFVENGEYNLALLSNWGIQRI